MGSLFIKFFIKHLLPFYKQHFLKQERAFLKVITEMGKKSRSFIDFNCKQNLLEDKENIKSIAVIVDNRRKSSKQSLNNYISAKSILNMKPKNISKSGEEKKPKSKKSSNEVLKKQIILNQCENSSNVSETLKAKKVRKPLVSSDSTQSAKLDLKKKDLSEIENNQSVYKFHNSLKIKEAVVVLDRYDDIQKEIMCQKSSDNSNVETTDVTSKSNKSLPECECHSAFLMKEAVVVLERCEEIQKKATVVKSYHNSDEKIDGKAKEASGKGKGKSKGTKRKTEVKTENEDEANTKSKKQKVAPPSKSSKKEDIPDVSALDFNNDSKSPNGNLWNFKIASWNINGIRSWIKQNGLSYLHHEQPDILCIQETKCSDKKLPDEVKKIDGYHVYWLSGDKEGYSGVGLITKEKPIKVEYGIGVSEHDNEGRVITAEYEKFYLVSSYVPNAGRGLVRLDYRMQWDKDFREYIKKLDAEKPVILCGDLNVAHEEIDLANPKTNKKNAGFTKEEREGFSTLLKEGFIDTFRHLYPNAKGAYTFWTYMMNARAKNVGWRLDYFVISERFTDNLCDNVIRKDVLGSDHCPITLFLSL